MQTTWVVAVFPLSPVGGPAVTGAERSIIPGLRKSSGLKGTVTQAELGAFHSAAKNAGLPDTTQRWLWFLLAS